MKMNHYSLRLVSIVWGIGVCLFLTFPSKVFAKEISEAILNAIEKRFPGADIQEVESETWQGQSVIEVELTSQSGISYEVIVSNNGKILNVEEEDELPWFGGELSLGAALSIERDIYKDVDTEFQPAPFFLYENGRLEIQATDNLQAAFTLYENDIFSVACFGSLEFDEGYDPDDSDYLKGMDELDTLYSAGLELEFKYEGWNVGLEFSQDVSGNHDGQEIELSLGYPLTIADFTLLPELSVSWMSKKTVDYLYGVSNKESRSNRPAYSPKSSFGYGADIMIIKPVFGNFTAVGIIGIEAFDSEITDSPIVDRDYAIEGAAGLMYSF